MNYYDNQILTAIDIIKQKFGQDLLAIQLFGSRVNTRLKMRNDIDLLIITKCSEIRKIISSMKFLLQEQEAHFGNMNKLTHTPLLIVANDLPLFGPTFSLGIMKNHKCIYGEDQYLHTKLMRHIGLTKKQSETNIQVFVFWELLRVCKEIIDTYVENVALKRHETNEWIAIQKASRRVVKAFIYGCRLVGYLNCNEWCMESIPELQKKTGIVGITEYIYRKNVELVEDNVLKMITPLYTYSTKIWESY